MSSSHHTPGHRVISRLGAAIVTVGICGLAHAQHYPPEFDLDELENGGGDEGFVIYGEDGKVGGIIANVGDINDDGIDDLALPGSRSITGPRRLYVLFGSPTLGATGEIDLAGPFDGSTGFFIEETEDGSGFGTVVSSRGDLNNDGVDDLVVGAAGSDVGNVSNAGRVYVIFGRKGIGGTGQFQLDSLDGSNGFVLNGILENDRAGATAFAGDDLNGDTISDLVISAGQCSSSGDPLPGEVYVIWGKTGLGASGSFDLASLATGGGVDGFVIPGEESCDHLGSSACIPGDLNDDEFNDLVISAYSADRDNLDFVGMVYILWGGPGIGTGGVVDLTTLAAPDGMRIRGEAEQDLFGYRLAPAGDWNHDGIDDVAISASSLENVGVSGFAHGGAYVLYGNPALDQISVGDLSSLDRTTGVKLLSNRSEDVAGTALGFAGDLNNDGMSDLIIGAPGNNVIEDRTGSAYVLFGQVDNDDIVLQYLNEKLDSIRGFRLNGYDLSQRAGAAVASGDFNDDQITDVVVGAPNSHNDNGLFAGNAYVLWGRNSPPPLDLAVGRLEAGQNSTFLVLQATPGKRVFLGYSLGGLGTLPLESLGVTLALESPVNLIGSAVATQGGIVLIQRYVPQGAGGFSVYLQACQSGRLSRVQRQFVNP